MNEYLRDYKTASQIFRTSVYKGAPKLKFLFHTYFDINTEAYDQGLNTGRNFGLEVRDVKLPSYSFKTSQLNQYNRKRIVQTKINYEEVSITFFDDNNNLINKLWEAYYRYYYADGGKPKVVFGSTPPGGVPVTQVGAGGVVTTNNASSYNSRNIYDDSITGNTDWGYIGETSKPGGPVGKKVPFFKNITVFGFSPGNNFTAYTLINPLITSFGHDTFNYDEGGGVMKNSMRLDYETVVYNYGNMGSSNPGDIVKGFALPESYDRRTSPNATSNRNVPFIFT
jgi:hypothetical protein